MLSPQEISPSIVSRHAPTRFQLMVNPILFTPLTTENEDKEQEEEDRREKRRKEVTGSRTKEDKVVKFSISGFKKRHLC